ncbi:hypothetical protein B0H13DRAFT_2289095 [Mycena leptocephala]|nr:hypothetical protein B0H13DRAFT_2289095 [Mycena leptocephala]
MALPNPLHWGYESRAEPRLTNKHLFAVIVAIDEYSATEEFPRLHGSVNDGIAVQQMTEPPARTSQMHPIPLSGQHENPQRRNGHDVLFFSGHGSRAKVEGNLIAADNKVEVICPVDERTKRMGEYVYAIPDYVLGWLLREVAAEKGPNIIVILDCCHSGGIGRDDKRARAPLDDSRSIPPGLDSSLWRGKTDKIESYRLWSPLPTFVLLAACSQLETAWEEKYGGKHHGRFTKHLIDQLVATDLENTTYEELITGIQSWPNRLRTAEGCYPAAGPHALALMPYPDSGSTLHTPPLQRFQVNMGTVAGVVLGTEFSICGPDNKFLGTFVAESVGVGQTILVVKKGTPPFYIPPGSRAVVSDWKNELLQIRTGTVLSDGSHQRAERRERYVIDRLTGLMNKYHRKIRVALSAEHLPDVMDCIAHFNYFLKHANEAENNTLRAQTGSGIGQDGNMLKNGEARFAPEAGAKYGFTIYNASRADLFPYLVYFDSHKYTIQLIYAPEGPTAQAPLKSGQSLTVGIGSTPAFEFTLPEDLHREGGSQAAGSSSCLWPSSLKDWLQALSLRPEKQS